MYGPWRARAGIRIEDLVLRHLESKAGDPLPADSTWERVLKDGQVQRYACAKSGHVGLIVDLWRSSDGPMWDVLSKVSKQWLGFVLSLITWLTSLDIGFYSYVNSLF
jgi:hypothetical protein